MSSAEEDAAAVVDEAGTDTEAEEPNVSATQPAAAAAPPTVLASPQPVRAASPVRAAAVPAAPAATISPKRKSSVGFIRPAEKLHVQARDPETALLLKALQDVYNTKLKPVEELWSFNHYHQDAMTTADLEAKPQVLLLGQYSTGKTSFIRYMLGRDFPGMHIGPEPSTEAFQVSFLQYACLIEYSCSKLTTPDDFWHSAWVQVLKHSVRMCILRSCSQHSIRTLARYTRLSN
jgi:N-terminal EH-domain containing protein